MVRSYLPVCVLLVASFAGCDSPRTPSAVLPAAAVEEPQKESVAVAPIQALPPQELIEDLENLPDSNAQSPPTDKPGQRLFWDDFADLAASQNSVVDGVWKRDPTATRVCFPFRSPSFQGHFSLFATECPDVLGADGRPGVVSFEWNRVPESADYSGFRYDGRVAATGRLRVPRILAAQTPDDLRGIKFRIKFKAYNETAGDAVAVKFDLRMESLEDGKSDNRMDFGWLRATSQWKAFEIDLADADNLQRFLEASSRHGSGIYVLAIGQVGSINEYHDGDGLQIDDIEFVSLRTEEDDPPAPASSNRN